MNETKRKRWWKKMFFDLMLSIQIRMKTTIQMKGAEQILNWTKNPRKEKDRKINS